MYSIGPQSEGKNWSNFIETLSTVNSADNLNSHKYSYNSYLICCQPFFFFKKENPNFKLPKSDLEFFTGLKITTRPVGF